MEMYLLNNNLERIAIIEFYTSLVWESCFNDVGEFRLVFKYDRSMFEMIKEDYFLWRRDIDEVMIIEGIDVVLNDRGERIVNVSGRNAISIFDRRIIWNTETLSNSFETNIYRIVYRNVINPLVGARKINYIDFEIPTTDSGKDVVQVSYKSLLDTVLDFCKRGDLGIKASYNGINLVIRLYKGKMHRSVDIEPVVFSDMLDNVLKIEYKSSKKGFKNVCLVAGEDSGVNRKKILIDEFNAVGMDRREMYVDARDIQSETEEGEVNLTEEEYSQALLSRGQKALSTFNEIKTLECDIDSNVRPIFRDDFNLGDTISVIESELGIKIDDVVTSVEEVIEGDRKELRLVLGIDTPSIAVRLKEVINSA